MSLGLRRLRADVRDNLAGEPQLLLFVQALLTGPTPNFPRIFLPMFKRNLLSVLALGTFVGLATGSGDSSSTYDEDDWGALEEDLNEFNVGGDYEAAAEELEACTMACMEVDFSEMEACTTDCSEAYEAAIGL